MIELKITGEDPCDIRNSLLAFATAFGVAPEAGKPQPVSMDEAVEQFTAMMNAAGFDVIVQPTQSLVPAETIAKEAPKASKPDKGGKRAPKEEPELAPMDEDEGTIEEQLQPKEYSPKELKELKAQVIARLQEIYLEAGGRATISRLQKKFAPDGTKFSELPAEVFPAIMQEIDI